MTNGFLTGGADPFGFIVGGLFGSFLFFVILYVVLIIALWKIFEKSGQPGWASIIPIYNTVVLLQIIRIPAWYVVFLFIPAVNIVAAIIIWVLSSFGLARVFGKSQAFGAGLFFLAPIFIMILAFDDSRYLYQKNDVPLAPPQAPTSQEVPASYTTEVPQAPDTPPQAPLSE